MTDTITAEEFHRNSTGTALTNAERQRRYRQRKAGRNACGRQDRNDNALTVTPREPGGDVMLLCAQQDKIEIYFDEEGDAVITQKRWPDEDQIIIVSHDNIETFIDKLTDAFGIPSFGGPA